MFHNADYSQQGAHKVTTRAIIIGTRAAGEGNLRMSFYTESLGLVSALATSAREERSQLRAHLQEGTFGFYTFILGKNTWRVTGAFQTKNIYFESRDNDPSMHAASRVIGIIRQLIHGEGYDHDLFASLWGFLAIAPTLHGKESRDAECLAILRTLSSLGYIEDAKDVRNFLGSRYDVSRLEEVRKTRPRLVRLINEGISASGL